MFMDSIETGNNQHIVLSKVHVSKFPESHPETEHLDLAKQINEAHENLAKSSARILDAIKSNFVEAIQCGKKILIVKDSLAHGKFESWCADNLKFKIRTA